MGSASNAPISASRIDAEWPSFRVLCVDDNADCADSTAMLLSVMGFEAKACYDGESAQAMVEQFKPSVCFLDLNMPRLDGHDLALKLRDAPGWHPLVLVALTAMSNEASSARIKAAGFHLHLIKPVDPAKLLEVVDLLYHLAASDR